VDVESAKYWLSWLDFGSKLAVILVVIGVGYEFVEKRFGAPLHQVIEDAKNSQIAESNRVAAQANLEAERLRLEIAKMKAPRAFTPEQRANLVAQLKLPSVPDWMREWGVEVIIDNDDQEARRFGEELSADLKAANWSVRVNPNADRRAMTGVVIEVMLGLPQLTDPAGKLAAALRSEGISVNGPNALSTHDMYPTIRVRVGRKP